MAQILIADDEEGFRFLLKRTLETSGHEVREAGDGDAAVATLRTYPAQLAIVDLFMPGKEGIETIIEIRRRHPEVKVVAISGGAPQTGTSFLSVAKKLGAHQTLTKPFSADELLLVVSHLLGCTSFTSSPPACANPTPPPATA
jgi:DNA-binding response OmpR family regulator